MDTKSPQPALTLSCITHHWLCPPGSGQKVYAYKGAPCSPCPQPGTQTLPGGLSDAHLNSERNGYASWRACITQPGYGAWLQLRASACACSSSKSRLFTCACTRRTTQLETVSQRRYWLATHPVCQPAIHHLAQLGWCSNVAGACTHTSLHTPLLFVVAPAPCICSGYSEAMGPLPCEQGSWSPGNTLGPCTPCSEGLTTASPWSPGSHDDAGDCLMGPGYGYHGGKVVPCPEGAAVSSLQDQHWWTLTLLARLHCSLIAGCTAMFVLLYLSLQLRCCKLLVRC
jgi:hypothetical protein